MKLNKKGFTLIELLAVVVLLLAISTIAISSISAAIERNKKKQNEATQRVIIGYAELYYKQHRNTDAPSKNCCILVSQLIDKTDLTKDETKNADGDYMDGGVMLDPNGSYIYSNNCGACH